MIVRSDEFLVEKQSFTLLKELSNAVHLNISEALPAHFRVWLIGPSALVEAVTSSPLFFTLTGRGNVNYSESSKIGEVGDKVVLMVTLIGKDLFQGSYGTSNLHRFLTDDGRVCSWLTKAVDLGVGRYELRGTIKGYDTDGRETYLTRCAVEKKGI
jgi:hypothetical protein